jgi:hypothetical protein
VPYNFAVVPSDGTPETRCLVGQPVYVTLMTATMRRIRSIVVYYRQEWQ